MLGCATTPEAARFSIESTPVSAPGSHCGATVHVGRGPVPVGARESVRFRVTISKPVALEEVEDRLRVHAARACADGVMVLQAVAADGAVGVTEVSAVAFVADAEMLVDDGEPR